jgi:hypothetical protein
MIARMAIVADRGMISEANLASRTTSAQATKTPPKTPAR